MLALMLATTLSLTLPAWHQAPPDSIGKRCEAGGLPLQNLWRLQLYGCPSWTGRAWTPADSVRCILDLDVTGREGEAVQIIFDDQGRSWTMWCETITHNLYRSCKSNQIGVGPGMGPGKVYPGAEPPDRP